MFLSDVYCARKQHKIVFSIDNALCSAHFERLQKLGQKDTRALFEVSGDVSVHSSDRENSMLGLPGLEPMLKVKHTELITNLEKEVEDHP